MLRQHEMSKGDHALQASTSENIVKKPPQPMWTTQQQNPVEHSSSSSGALKNRVERPFSANRSSRSDAVARAPSGVPTALKASTLSEGDGGHRPRPGHPQSSHKPTPRVAWADLRSGDHAPSSSSSMPLRKGNASPLPTTLTGNSEADADIQAFYAARDKLLAARNRR